MGFISRGCINRRAQTNGAMIVTGLVRCRACCAGGGGGGGVFFVPSFIPGDDVSSYTVVAMVSGGDRGITAVAVAVAAVAAERSGRSVCCCCDNPMPPLG